MRMVLRCDCGFKAVGDTEDDLVVAARDHASEAHGIDLAAEVVSALVRARHRPSDDGHGDVRGA